ncbi:NACHT domain-containing protein [Streptomyces sp. NPDC004290]
MDAPSAVVDFCETLRRLVHGCGVQQTDLARALHRADSTVSELLKGRRTTPPHLDLVLEIVRYCRDHGGTHRPPGLSLDPSWWRTRHAELEYAADIERASAPKSSYVEPNGPAGSGGTAPLPAWPADQPPPWLETGRLDFAVAIDILHPGREPSEKITEQLLEPLTLTGSAPADVRELFGGYAERVRAAHGTARTTLLCAADVVVHVAAFCTAVQDSGISPGPAWGTGSADLSTEVLEELARVELGSSRFRDPLELRAEIAASYEAASGIVLAAGDAPDRGHGALASEALRCYDRLLSSLTWTCPELRLTSETSVVPEDMDEPVIDGSGLERLGRALAGFAGGAAAPARHSSRLRAPIAATEGSGSVLPTLAEGYVDPSFRIAQYPVDRDLASDEWWERQPIREDLAGFLAVHLLTARATRAPLLVLGHPGSGKSLLTRLIAARLPESEFHCVHVELRHVSADVGVQEQIEAELLRTTGRRTPLPDMADPESGRVRVVLLDGLDELLQAGARQLDARRQWNYLRDVERIQEREAEWGRPTVIVVTSRTVVADRTHTPAATTVLRLEPFDETRIRRWLTTWERVNAHLPSAGEAGALTWEVLSPHHALAKQPLLLLLLALYNAAGRPLRRATGEAMGRVELYERLLSEFVRREVVRRGGSLPPREEETAIEEELLRLGVIATGMFNRRSQSIMARDAERDICALLGEQDSLLLFGRFFFVHEAQAVAEQEEIRSYEFLHATFGEYLVARGICHELRRVLGGTTRTDGVEADDGRLRALLSPVPLTDRAEILSDAKELLHRGVAGRTVDLLELLRGLFARVLASDEDDRGDPGLPYRPLRQSRVERDAVYTVNLLLLAVLCAGEEGLEASGFLSADAPVERWWRCAHLWRSQLGQASWSAFTQALAVQQRFSDTDGVTPRDLWLSLGRGPDPDAGRALSRRPAGRPRSYRGQPSLDMTEIVRRISFLGDTEAAHLLHTVLPVLERFPGTMDTYHLDASGSVRAVSHVLLVLACRADERPEALTAAYEGAASALHLLPDDSVSRVIDILAPLLARDARRLRGRTVLAVLKTLTSPVSGRPAPDVGTATWATLLACAEEQAGRDDVPADDLGQVITRLGRLLAHDGAGSPGQGDLRRAPRGLATALREAGSTRLWFWTSSGRLPEARLLDEAREAADRVPGQARSPETLVGALRLARELGRDDWLAEHAEPLLRTLGPAALGLLRPSDVDFLRPLVADAGLLAVFHRIEKVWRGRRASG